MMSENNIDVLSIVDQKSWNYQVRLQILLITNCNTKYYPDFFSNEF